MLFPPPEPGRRVIGAHYQGQPKRGRVYAELHRLARAAIENLKFQAVGLDEKLGATDSLRKPNLLVYRPLFYQRREVDTVHGVPLCPSGVYPNIIRLS